MTLGILSTGMFKLNSICFPYFETLGKNKGIMFLWLIWLINHAIIMNKITLYPWYLLIQFWLWQRSLPATQTANFCLLLLWFQFSSRAFIGRIFGILSLQCSRLFTYSLELMPGFRFSEHAMFQVTMRSGSRATASSEFRQLKPKYLHLNFRSSSGALHLTWQEHFVCGKANAKLA